MSDPALSDTELSPSSPLDDAIAARDRDTMNMVRAAIRNDNVLLAFQPVISVAAPDQPAFHEAFIRVLDDTGRIIPAGDFMPAIENDVMGRELDTLALEKGLDVLRKVPGLRLSINMSARSIGFPGFGRVLDNVLRDEPSVGERLILEITERSCYTLPDVVRAFMDDMHMKGVSFALDDFGTSFTSFQQLRDLYFDFIKIDGGLVRKLDTTPDNQMIIRAIIAMSREMDLFTVAENVEGPQVAAILEEAGIDCMQGYFFGAPTVTPYWAREGSRAAV